MFIWNLYGVERPPAPGRANLEQAWADLSKVNRATAFSMIKLLAAWPEQSTKFLREVLLPIASPEDSKVNQLIDAPDHRDFRKRELAARELTNLAERAGGR